MKREREDKSDDGEYCPQKHIKIVHASSMSPTKRSPRARKPSAKNLQATIHVASPPPQGLSDRKYRQEAARALEGT